MGRNWTKRKAYKKELEAIKEYYRPKKYRKTSKHKDWKTDWKGYVESTYPWDGSAILELIVYRLEVLAASIRYYGHHVNSERDVSEIEELVALGRKVVADNYAEDAQKFADEHCAHIMSIHKYDKGRPNHIGEKLGEIIQTDVLYDFEESSLKAWCKEHNLKKSDVRVTYNGKWDSEENYDKWLELLSNSSAAREKDKKQFFLTLAERLEDWWD